MHITLAPRNWALAILLFCLGGNAAMADIVLYSGEGERYDLGIEVEGRAARLYLADKVTNEPLAGKIVEYVPDDGGDLKFSASAEPGLYLALLPEGTHLIGQIIVNYEKEDEDTIELSDPGHVGHEDSADHADHDAGDSAHADHTQADSDHGDDAGHEKSASEPAAGKVYKLWQSISQREGGWLLALFGGGLFLLGWSLGRMRGRGGTASSTVLFAAFLSASFSESIFASEGHAHAEVGVSTPGEGSTIVVTKKSQFLIGLRCEEAKRSQEAGVFRTFGHIVAKPQLDARIRAPRDGVLRGIEENIWGKQVNRGQAVAKIDAVGLVNVTSPISGTVIQATGVSGARISAGDEIMRVVDMSKLWVDAEVFQRDLLNVKSASTAFVTLESGENSMSRQARLVGAQTIVDEQTMAGKIFLEIDNSDGAFSIGNTVQVHFKLEDKAIKGMKLPSVAVLKRGAETIVYIKTGAESFEPRPVAYRPGPDPGTVVVTKGLNPGDRVVVSGNYQLLVGAK